MPWRRFVFTKAFWADETPVYVAFFAFLILTALLPVAMVLGAGAWFGVIWVWSFVAFTAAIVVRS